MGFARRALHGHLIAIIVLSFAPSAAAVWHCEPLRITCGSNSARRSVFLNVAQGIIKKNPPKIIPKWNQNGPEILPKGVSGGHPSLSGPTSDTGRISRPSREPCFAVSASLGDPLGTPRGPIGQPFRNLFLSGRAQNPKMDAFLADLFSDAFLHVFLWISGASRTLKPWIP